VLREAEALAAGYDYDGAIACLKEYGAFAASEKLQETAASYEAARDATYAVDVTTVPHIFFTP